MNSFPLKIFYHRMCSLKYKGVELCVCTPSNSKRCLTPLYFKEHVRWWKILTPIVHRGIVSPTLNVNPTLFVNPWKIWGILELQCCKKCHLPSDFSSKFQSSMTIELYFNSSWLSVGSWLFCLQKLPCLVSFWCMRGGSVEVWTKNILYQFMKGQTHFGMQRGAKMSLALHEPI